MTSPSQIPHVMKGLQITEFKKPYKLTTGIPVPKIQRENDVLIKIAVAGYCRTDVAVHNAEFKSNKLPGDNVPLIPSHEGAGVVVAIGSQVRNVKVGDRVATLCIKSTCERCADCKQGFAKYCEHSKFSGITVDGAAAEYMIADSAWTISLPNSLSFESSAPLTCAGATIYSALKTANLHEGQSVAIIGAGGLGHLGVQFAKCMGLNVVCVDSREAPLDLVRALKYAPDYTINATKGVDAALQVIGGQGVDATLVATDAIPAHEFGLALTKKHGTLVVIGVPFDPIPIHYHHLIYRNLTIKGSLISDVQLAKEMVDLVIEKGIEVKTRSYPLEDVEQLLKDYHMETHSGKLVLRVSRDI